MAYYPDPCLKCPRNKGYCNMYKDCQEWRTRYLYRQKQINAYAKKVLPDYYKKLAEQQEKFSCMNMDEHGFCRKYSRYDIEYKCPENGDCDGYMEVDYED